MIKACHRPGEHEAGQITQPRMRALESLKGEECEWGHGPGRGNGMSIWYWWTTGGVASNVRLATCNVQIGRGGARLAHGGTSVPAREPRLCPGVNGCT